MKPATSGLIAICMIGLAAGLHATGRPVNLLFIMTDQQRWDAMSCAGNSVIKTPNLDRLAREGARFTNFYSSFPTCAPARTTMLTGHSIEFTKVRGNADVARPDVPKLPTFDQILLQNGYRGEYHGKWHSPYSFAAGYTQPVRWLNARGAPAGADARSGSEADAYRKYLQAHVPPRDPRPGELLSRNGIYMPVPLDAGFGKAAAAAAAGTTGDDDAAEAQAYGRLDVPVAHTHTAWTAGEGLAAMERLKGGPFTLTISIGPPHPPMVVPDPYFSLYPPASIPIPASIDDPLTNSPYAANKAVKSDRYRNRDNIRQMASIYYGMVTEVDDWVGRILRRLDELGLADHTLVIFTSDHGEMLGEHGMQGKGLFYQGAVHIPLLMRLPGMIPAGKVVSAPTAQIDLFATILDYCGLPAHASQGRSLRPLIAGQDDGRDRVAIAENAKPGEPGFMVFDGRWKLLFGRTADAASLDALFDLKSDPHELNNLIGRNPDRAKFRPEAERLKRRLVAWLEQTGSPLLATVKARPAVAMTIHSPAKKGKRKNK